MANPYISILEGNPNTSSGKQTDSSGWNVEQLSQIEKEEATRRVEERIRLAYQKDPTSSYNKNMEEAKGSSFSGRRDEFIRRVRQAAVTKLQQEDAQNYSDLRSKYGINTDGTISNESIPGIDVDITSPSIATRVGMVLGSLDNTSSTVFNNDSSGVIAKTFNIGENGYLNKGVDVLTSLSDKATDIVNLESPWIKKRLSLLNIPEEEFRNLLPDSMAFAGGTIYKFLTGFAEVLNEWYHDPRTLCCFIKNIAALASYEKSQMTKEEAYAAIFRGGASFASLTGTENFLNKLIAILEIARAFLIRGLGFDIMLNLDLGLMMDKAGVGAMVAVLTTLYQMLKDEIYYKLMELMKSWATNNFTQCLPLDRLLRLVVDIMTGPEGIFNFIEKFIDSYLSELSSDMNYGFNQSKKSKMMDVTAIDKLIALLAKIRDAVLNFELCIEADFSGQTQEANNEGNGQTPSNEISYDTKKNYTDLVTDKTNTNKDSNTRGITPYVVFPTDSEVESFIKNRMGESTEFAKQVIAVSKNTKQPTDSVSSVTGAGSESGVSNLVSTLGDCAKTISPDRILELSKLMSNWEIKI